jgi:FMN phosphatase YigB (HAD superfamily)
VSVGDSLENDIDAAHEYGWKTVWVNRDNRSLPEQSHPDAVLTSLEGLAAVLEQLGL